MNVSRKEVCGLLVAVCVCFTSPVRAADVDPFLPNDAEVVAHVNIRQLLDSPLVKQFALEHMKAALKSNSEVQTVFQQLGFDPFADLSSFTVAGPAGDDPNRGVAIVHGNFNQAKFEARADEAIAAGGLKSSRAGDYTVYEVSVPQGPAQTVYVAIPDARTLVASPNKEMLGDALDKHAGKKKSELNGDLRNRIEKHPNGDTAWIVALSKGLGKSVVATDLTAREFLEKSITLGSSVTVSQDVVIAAVIDAKNSQDAAVLQKKLSDLIDQGKGILQAFAQSQKELAPLLDLANSLKVTANDKTVTLKGTIPQAVIEKAVTR